MKRCIKLSGKLSENKKVKSISVYSGNRSVFMIVRFMVWFKVIYIKDDEPRMQHAEISQLMKYYGFPENLWFSETCK